MFLFKPRQETVIRRSRPSIGFLDIRTQNNGQTQVSIRGTVFAVDKEHFLSCYHVYQQILESDRQYIGISVLEPSSKKTANYKRFPAKIIAYDQTNDVALFKIEKCTIAFNGLLLGNAEKLEEGNELIYTGFPLATEFLSMGLGITLASTKCIASAIKRKSADESLDYIQIDAHTSSGSSGSPIFSLQDGKVIGVVAGNFGQQSKTVQDVRVPEVMGIIRPINYGKKLLEDNSVKYRT